MNSSEVLSTSPKMMKAVYDGIFNYLKTIAEPKGLTLAEKEPQLVKQEAAFTVNNFGLLRFSVGKGNSTYALGSTDPEFMTKWKESFPQAAADPESKTKSYEFELMKHLFVALDPGVKALGLTPDPKTAVIQEGVALGGWAQLNVTQSVRMTIGLPAGELVFDVPVFDTEFAKNLTTQLYGFPPTARMLVVDDSMVSRKYSRSCLAMAGYFNVEEVQDGQQALNKIMGTRPPFDTVLADWHMPVMSGFDLLKKVRELPEFKKLPIIMMTGEKNKDEVIAAIRAGATAYLVKPVAIDAFYKALAKAGGRG